MQPAPHSSIPAGGRSRPAAAAGPGGRPRPRGGGSAGRGPSAGPGRARRGRRAWLGRRARPARRLGGRVLVRVAEDHRRPAAERGGQRQLMLERGVGDAEQHQVGGLGQVSQRRVAAAAADLGVARVHRVDDRPGRRLRPTSASIRSPKLPGRARRADDRHRPRLEHRRSAGRSRPGCGREPLRMNVGGHAQPAILCPCRALADLLTLRSARAARAACQPGMPQTPPPACVAELP